MFLLVPEKNSLALASALGMLVLFYEVTVHTQARGGALLGALVTALSANERCYDRAGCGTYGSQVPQGQCELLGVHADCVR